MLHQGCIALECLHVKGLELLTRQGGPLPDVFNQLAPSGSRQQRVRRFWFEKACSSIGRYRRRFSSREEIEHIGTHDEVIGGPFALYGSA